MVISPVGMDESTVMDGLGMIRDGSTGQRMLVVPHAAAAKTLRHSADANEARHAVEGLDGQARQGRAA